MSEEIQRASIVVPQAIILSVLINGVLGFSMVLALMFCVGDVQAALAAQKTLGYPFLEVFLQAVNSVAGACLMASLVVILGVCSTVGSFASSSRILWSFSRDRGTPLWKTLSKVSSLEAGTNGSIIANRIHVERFSLTIEQLYLSIRLQQQQQYPCFSLLSLLVPQLPSTTLFPLALSAFIHPISCVPASSSGGALLELSPLQMRILQPSAPVASIGGLGVL